MKKSDQAKIARIEKQIDQLARKIMMQKIKAPLDGQKKACGVKQQPKDYI